MPSKTVDLLLFSFEMIIIWTEEIVTLEKLKEFPLVGFVWEFSLKLKTSASLEPNVTKNLLKVSSSFKIDVIYIV